MEEQLLQVALHLSQYQEEDSVWKQVVAGVSCGSGIDQAARPQGPGANLGLKAGDVDCDLTEQLGDRALQLHGQESKVMSDLSESHDGRRAEPYV